MDTHLIGGPYALDYSCLPSSIILILTRNNTKLLLRLNALNYWSLQLESK